MALAKSKDVINYLKKNLDKKNFASIFVCGSIPEFIGPGKDLDLFIVMKSKRELNSLDDLEKSMKKLTKKYDKLTHSFFRGPLKYKNKGLIHILTYTDESMKNHEKLWFEKEYPNVLSNLMKTKRVIIGKHPKKLIKRKPTKKEIDEAKTHFKANYLKVKKENKFSKQKWIKTKNGWKLKRQTITPSKFLRNDLMKYYEKWI